MNKCKRLLCLLLVVSSLFSLFCVNVHALDNENLIDSNMSNWVDIGESDPDYFQPANVYDYGNGYNYIEVYSSSKSVLLVDITKFLKIGESYRFSFGLPTTDGVNNSALTSCTIAWGLVDGGGYTDFPSIGASVFEIEINNDNKSKFLGKNTSFEFTYTQGYKNTYLALVIEPRENLNAYNYLQLYITDVKLERIESEEEGLLKNLLERIQIIINNIRDGFSGISNSLSNGFNNLKNGLIELKNNILELPQKIANSFKNLFVPSENYFVDKMDEMQAELELNLGAVYQVSNLLDDFFTSFNADVTTNEIEVPLLTVDLLGYPFSFGGWNVSLIPDYRLQFLADACKFVVGVLTTFALLYGLRKKYDEIVGGGDN